MIKKNTPTLRALSGVVFLTTSCVSTPYTPPEEIKPETRALINSYMETQDPDNQNRKGTNQARCATRALDIQVDGNIFIGDSLVQLPDEHMRFIKNACAKETGYDPFSIDSKEPDITPI